MEVVVLPTPPFWLMRAMMFLFIGLWVFQSVMSPDGSQNIKFAFDLEGKELIIRYSAFPDVPRLPTRKPQRCAWPRSRFLIQRAPWGLICGGSELDLELQRRLPPLRIRWPV